jgi:hypothetical protein
MPLFAAHAANPIAVMTQDTSRDFLSGSGEAADRKKYQLFMEVRRRMAGVIESEVAESIVSSLCHCFEVNAQINYLVWRQATRLAEVHENLAEAEAYIGQMEDAIKARRDHANASIQVCFRADQPALLSPCMTCLVLTHCSWRRPS